ncbi:MAG TPA: hypothetical protein VLK65_23290 [Vicinamibacteria bacterium]|nr:hypothetical protein [Vicinamibacteria bacterium]
MRLEAATLSLEPRPVGVCIDLAILFYRRHAGKLVALSALFGALPVTVGALRAADGDGFIWTALLFFYGSSFLGAAIVAGAGHHVFGEPFTLTNALGHFYRRKGSLLILLPIGRTLLALVGIMCWGVPFIPLGVRNGFLAEVLILEQLKGARAWRRLQEVLRRSFLDACGRYTAILSFAAIVSAAMFLLVDISCDALFGVPILVAKVSWAMAFEDISNLVSYDPLLVATLASILWLVYPLARLAWFFCYLDARIRKEGWDVEIDYRLEARRIV